MLALERLLLLKMSLYLYLFTEFIIISVIVTLLLSTWVFDKGLVKSTSQSQVKGFLLGKMVNETFN